MARKHTDFEINSRKKYLRGRWIGLALVLFTIAFWALALVSIPAFIWVDWRWLPTGIICAIFGVGFYYAADDFMTQLEEAKKTYGTDED